MRTRTLYNLTLTVLIFITLAGIIFTGNRLNESERLPALEGANLELTYITINYSNNTGLYQYGAELRIANTRPSTMTLSSLQVGFSGVGRDSQWSGVCPILGVTLASGESKEITTFSPDVQPSLLGMLGTTRPSEYLDLAIKQTNLGLSCLERNRFKLK